MNTSIIIGMLREDPTIADDVPGFLARVNEQNIRVVRQRHVEVIDEEVMVSLAERNGGPATERDVTDALQIMAAQPLLEQAANGFEQLRQAIMNGQCQSMTDVAAMVNQLAQTAVENEPTS